MHIQRVLNGRIFLPLLAVVVLVAMGCTAQAAEVKPEEVDQLRQDMVNLKGELEILRDDLLGILDDHELIEREHEEVVHQHDHYGATLDALLPLLEPTTEYTLTTVITGFRDAGGENPTIHVKQGDLVKLTLTNTEYVQHDFVIDELGVHSPHLAPGLDSTVSFAFLATEVGEFAYYCSIPGHRETGMEGILIVEPTEGLHDEGTHAEGGGSEDDHTTK